ncbi:MAG: SRPBCC domain-containing protein [Phycisphaeraceae bacterium]|nr:SRPBCC domain-containing protein [Phycisphaeraceae bacterium]
MNTRKNAIRGMGVGLAVALLFAFGVGGVKSMVGPTGEPQAVDSAMFVAGGMEAPAIDVSIAVNAPRGDVYNRFTTSDGWKKFMGTQADLDLRIGGQWEIYFDPNAKIGSNGCQVLSYVPDEMVSFSWNAPPKFSEERAKRTWVVVTFTDAAGGKSNVRLRQFGFATDGNWPEVKEYFVKAWPRVLDALKESYEEK